MMRYKSSYPNHVHQLLVSVSKHYLVGAKGVIRHQKKKMDVSLKNFEKSDREHLVYYILRDHFSGFYYVEVNTTKRMIPLIDFLMRAFLQKPDMDFCGVPEILMIPKQVEEHFSPIDEILADLGIGKMYPPSGFASGMIAVKNWEELMKIPLLPFEGFNEIKYWNPRTAIRYLDIYTEENYEKWKAGSSDIKVPDNQYVQKITSEEFKFAQEYPLYIRE